MQRWVGQWGTPWGLASALRLVAAEARQGLSAARALQGLTLSSFRAALHLPPPPQTFAMPAGTTEQREKQAEMQGLLCGVLQVRRRTPPRAGCATAPHPLAASFPTRSRRTRPGCHRSPSIPPSRPTPRPDAVHAPGQGGQWQGRAVAVRRQRDGGAAARARVPAPRQRQHRRRERARGGDAGAGRWAGRGCLACPGLPALNTTRPRPRRRQEPCLPLLTLAPPPNSPPPPHPYPPGRRLRRHRRRPPVLQVHAGLLPIPQGGPRQPPGVAGACAGAGGRGPGAGGRGPGTGDRGPGAGGRGPGAG
jgi:hypothetical protein